MGFRVTLSIFILLLGLLPVYSIRCSSSQSMSNYKCPDSRPKCCGTRRNGRQSTCATSCIHFKCETNFDCDGLTCCSGNCSNKHSCLAVTTWGVVGIAIVCLFVVLALFRTCQWCRKMKCCRQQDRRVTNEEVNNEPPFVVSDFENHGFITPMAPPTYESVIENTGTRNESNPPVYNLNLQTIINNSSTNDPRSNNFEVNISIRGSTMFVNDFPPSYSEISNSCDGVDQTLSSSGDNDNIQQRRLRLSYSDEPPPYSLNEQTQNSLSTEASPSNTTREQFNMENDVALEHVNDSEEGQQLNRSISNTDSSQNSPHGSIAERTVFSSSEPTDDLGNDEQPCCNINQYENNTSSESQGNSRQSESV